MRLVLDGDIPAAADRLDAMGDLPDAAYARLRAAQRFVEGGRRADADVELRLALAFYRSAGATRFIQQAEGLLAATA